MDDRIGLARALGDLAGVELAAGRPEQASNRVEEAMGLTTESQPGRTRAEVLMHAAHVHARLGDEDRAQAFLREAEDIYEQIGDEFGLAEIRSQVMNLGGRPNDLDEELGRMERSRLLNALERENWNQSRAARLLGVTETRVRNLMRRHGLTPRNRRGRPRKSGGTEQHVA
jgi:transcriptional regulator with GAF, ATPase, and Fis domain